MGPGLTSSVKTLAVVFRTNTAEFAGAMAQQAAAIKGVADEAGRASVGGARSITRVGASAAAAGAVIAAGLGYAVKSAIDFEARMRDVNSIVDAGRVPAAKIQSDFRALSAEALTLSRKYGVAATEVANGLYYVASAGFTTAASSTQVLSASLLAARAGLADTVTTTRSVVAQLNAYGQSSDQATHVADVMFTVVKDGVTNFQDLAASTSLYVSTAAAAHVPIEQTGAALATMTREGASATRAGTQLNAVLQAFIKPSSNMTNAAHQLGYESAYAMLQALGLKGSIDQLRTATGGSVTTLAGLFQNIRAARGALALMSGDGKVYNAVFSDFSDKTKLAGAAQRAFEIQQKSTSYQLQSAKTNIQDAAIALGTRLLPAVRDVAGFVGNLGQSFTNLSSGWQTAIAVAGVITAAILGVGGALLLLLPRLAATKAAFSDVFGEEIAGKVGELAGTLGTLGAAAGALAVVGVGVHALAGYIDELISGPAKINDVTKALVDLADNGGKAADRAYASVEQFARGSQAHVGALIQAADAMKNAGLQGTDRYVAAQGKVRNALEDVDKALANMVKAGNAAAANDAITKLAQRQGISVPALKAHLTDYTKAVGDYTTATKLQAAKDNEATKAQRDKLAAQLPGISQNTKEKLTLDQLTAAVNAKKDADKAAAQELKDEQKAIQGFFDTTKPYQTQLDGITAKEQAHFEKLATNAGLGKEAWKDFVNGSVIDLKKYNTELEHQITAEQNWQKNLQTIAQKAGTGVATELEKMGPQAAPLVDAFAHDTTGQLQRWANDMQVQAALGTQNVTTQLDTLTTDGPIIMQNAGQLSADSLARYLGIGVDQVKAIADQYGVQLEDAVNPVLVATGNAPLQQFHVKGGGTVMAEGGRVAGINPGRPILWGEAGPEAYIPLSRDGRMPRSRAIASQVVSMLGGLAFFAQGGLVMAAGGLVPPVPSYSIAGYPVRQEAVAVSTYAHDKVAAQVAAAAQASGPAAPAVVSGNVALGKMMAAQRGWTGAQFDALYNLWMGESGWNNMARNASSGAFGIPQALPASKMGAAGASGDAAAQIAWGLSYIAGRYGSPSGAYGTWLSRSPHWYGQGGIVGMAAGGLMSPNGPLDALNTSIGPVLGQQALQGFATAAATIGVLGQQFVPIYQNALAEVGRITGAEHTLNLVLAQQSFQLADAKNASDAATAAYQKQETVVSGLQSRLSAAQQSLSDFGNAHLVGERAFSDQLFANDQAQKRIQLQMDDLKLAGQDKPTFDPMKAFAGFDPTKLSSGLIAAAQAASAATDPTIALQKQLDRLGLEADRTNLVESLQLDPLRRQLQQTADTSKELTFAEAMAGAQKARSEIGQLTPQLAAAQSKLIGLGAAQDQAKARMDAAQATYDATNAQLQVMDATVQQLTSSLQQLAQAADQFANEQVTVAPGVTIARRDLPAFSAWVTAASRHANGGIVGASYDQGGHLPLGWSLAYNGTGRPEPVGAAAGSIMVDMSGWVIQQQPGQSGAQLASEIAGAVDAAVGRRFASARRKIVQTRR